MKREGARCLKRKKTKSGYDFHELLSALQEDVRRRNVYPAMFWAAELERLNYKALWNRLRVITSEDVSLGRPGLVLVIDTLHRWYEDLIEEEKKKKVLKKEKQLFLAHAILALCDSPKSRIADNLVLTIYGERKFKGKKQKIPDYALDGYTLRGIKKGRNLKTREGRRFFLEVGAKLENETTKFIDKFKKKGEKIFLKHGEP